jgi:multimeric flavodoxin WrbA
MEARKVVILEGSPRRKGNSVLLAERLAAGAREAGADVEEFFLQSLKIAPCCACDSCRKKGEENGCVVQDDMQSIYASIDSASAVVFASPIYWFNVSAQLKTAIDRLYAYSCSDWRPLRSKSYAAILVFGDSDLYTSGGINAVRSIEDTLRFLGSERAEFLYGSADEPGEIGRNEELVGRAFALGKRLGSGS